MQRAERVLCGGRLCAAERLRRALVTNGAGALSAINGAGGSDSTSQPGLSIRGSIAPTV